MDEPMVRTVLVGTADAADARNLLYAVVIKGDRTLALAALADLFEQHGHDRTAALLRDNPRGIDWLGDDSVVISGWDDDYQGVVPLADLGGVKMPQPAYPPTEGWDDIPF